jgi:hypothetical protein
MDGIGGLRPKRVWVARRSQGPAPPGLFWPLGLTLLTSCASVSSRGKILTPEKSLVNLSPERSVKRKNTLNRVFLFYSVITKKIPINHYKT